MRSQARPRSRAGHDEPVHARGQQSVKAQLARDSSESQAGVSSLNTTNGRRRGRLQASARSVVGPYSQLTTQAGSAWLSARPTPRGTTTGDRPWPCPLPGAQGARLVGVALGEPLRALIPARSPPGLVDHRGLDPTPLGQQCEQRLAVRNRDRRQDRAAEGHARIVGIGLAPQLWPSGRDENV